MPHTPNYRVTLAVLAVGVCSYTLLQSMTVPTLPQIQHELGTDQATAAWVLTSFFLSASVATPIIGRLGDSYGKRKWLVISLSLLALGSLVAALASTIEIMIVARVVQGMSGGSLPLTFGIIRDEMPEEHVPFAISLSSSLLAIGFAVGIVVAGPVADLVGLRGLFLLPTLVSVGAALATHFLIEESPVRSRERIPITPAMLLAGWLIVLLLGVSKAPEFGWLSWPTASAAIVTIALFVAWIAAEGRAAIPLVDLRMMRTRGVWTANLVALLIGAAMYGAFGFYPQFTQTPTGEGFGFGASVTEAGYMMMPTAIASTLCGFFAARLMRAIGTRQVIAVGASITALGIANAAFLHDEKWQIYVAGGITGLGAGLCFACLANAVVDAVPPTQTGVATGMNANIRTIGASIGSAAMTTVVTAEMRPSGYPVETGYVAGFGALAVVAAAAAIASLLIPRRRRSGQLISNATLPNPSPDSSRA